MPAICREPAANPVHAECQASSGRLILLPLRGRSSECGPEQARSYMYSVNLTFLLLVLIWLFMRDSPDDTHRDLGAG